jgi:hypothetical protein
MNKYLNQYYILASILFLVSFKAPNVSSLALDYSVPGYVQTIQDGSSFIVLLLMAVSTINYLVIQRDRKTVPYALIHYFIFQIILILTGYFNEVTFSESIQKIVFIGVSFSYFYTVVSKLNWDTNKELSVPKSIFLGSSIFCAINLVLHLSSVANVMWKGRLFGVTGHPNFLGISGAICIVSSVCLLHNEKIRVWKYIYLVGVALGIYICFLSGSRTSAICSLAATSIFILNQLPNIHLKIILTCASILLGFLLYSTIDKEQVDYAGRGNTREQTWKELYLEVAELPIIGKGRVGASTNSYMFAIVAAGLLGSSFFFASLFMSCRIFFISYFGKLPDHYNIARSLLIILLIGSVFEGFLLDLIGMSVFLYWIILSRSKPLKKIANGK